MPQTDPAAKEVLFRNPSQQIEVGRGLVLGFIESPLAHLKWYAGIWYLVRDCAMSEFFHKFGRRLFLWISVLLLFGFAGRNQVEAADLPNGPIASVGAGPQFTV